VVPSALVPFPSPGAPGVRFRIRGQSLSNYAIFRAIGELRVNTRSKPPPHTARTHEAPATLKGHVSTTYGYDTSSQEFSITGIHSTTRPLDTTRLNDQDGCLIPSAQQQRCSCSFHARSCSNREYTFRSASCLAPLASAIPLRASCRHGV
jgi:hypothetical protein